MGESLEYWINLKLVFTPLHCWTFLGTEFGLALEELFQMSDTLQAPSVVIQCTTELEKRTRETGSYEQMYTL